MQKLTLTILVVSAVFLVGCKNERTDQQGLSGLSKTDETAQIKDGQELSTIASQWSDSVTRNRQSQPLTEENEASASYADARQLFLANPPFEQIIELSKRLEFYKLETSGAKHDDVDPIRIEYWGTLGADSREHGTIRITYVYGFPSVVDLYYTHRQADTKDSHDPITLLFSTYDEAIEKLEAEKTGG